jgi:pSer/pThr/pTyr-binding forkhead associated (FHA) protein
VAHFVNLNEDP